MARSQPCTQNLCLCLGLSVCVSVCVCLACVCVSLGVCHRRRVRLSVSGTGDCASSQTLRCRRAIYPFPGGNDAPPCPCASPPGVDRQASGDTALHLRCLCCTDRHLSCCRDTALRRALCQRRHREYVVQDTAPLYHAHHTLPPGCERVGHRIFVLCPPYSPPPHAEWTMIRFLIKLLILPPSRAKLTPQRTRFHVRSQCLTGPDCCSIYPDSKKHLKDFVSFNTISHALRCDGRPTCRNLRLRSRARCRYPAEKVSGNNDAFLEILELFVPGIAVLLVEA